MRKTTRKWTVTFRLTPDEHKLVSATATRLNLTVSELCRDAPLIAYCSTLNRAKWESAKHKAMSKVNEVSEWNFG